MSLTTLMNTLADSLAMDMKLKAGFLYGSRELRLEGLIEGVDLMIKPKVVHSLVDLSAGVVGVVVHVVGKLYLVAFSEEKSGDVTIIVINGAKIDWEAGKTPNVFGGHWTRKGLYEKILPGIEVFYTRFAYEDKWQVFRKGRKLVQDYLSLRKSGLNSGDAMKQVLGNVEDSRGKQGGVQTLVH